MKRIKSSLLAGLATLVMIVPTWKCGLKDITMPELGVYECTQARLGSRDCLQDFSHITLELKEGGVFILHYAEKNGEKREGKGTYEYDRTRKILTLTGGDYRREFPFSEGRLTVTVRLGEQTLTLTFEQK